MKTRMISLVTSVALIAGFAVAPAVQAYDFANVTRSLAGSTALELPAKTANLVATAAAADKQEVAIAAVKAAIGLNPASAVAIVSAVARDNPSTAPVAAVTAATLQHKQLGLIANAAVAAAPSQAGNIVAALIKEFPKEYSLIAVAASEAAPSFGREILKAVADNVPALQPAIQGAIAKFAANDSNIPVLAILSQSSIQSTPSAAPVALTPLMITVSAPPSLAPPTFGVPFTPVTTINNNVTVQNQAPGGRPYGAP